MHNLHLQFAYPWAPWLFLLLIPAALLTLIPYFFLNKRYRRTRNRITSIVLHLLVMLLCICVLTGFTFVYEESNLENEIILVVDMSETSETNEEARDGYVEAILREGELQSFRLGVVTFGFTQVHASEFTYDSLTAYENYLSAPLPDTSATDISAAILYAGGLFEHPQSGKIVLISDGKETDESALSTVNLVTARGIKFDSVDLRTGFEEDVAQIVGVEFPEYHIDVGQKVPVKVKVESRAATASSVITITDNGENPVTQVVDFTGDKQEIIFEMAFEEEGLHKVEVTITESRDGIDQNNSYIAYVNLVRFNRVLIIEQQTGQSEALKALLTDEEADFEVDVLNVKGGNSLPTSVDDLRAYDQVIINNIANSDIEDSGLDKLLYSYVYDYGGGLFTVGGSDAEDENKAHAYNREDLRKDSGRRETTLQQMLPVEAIDYTPPVGVVFIIDISGSMIEAAEDGQSKLYWAKRGAIASLQALSERDYVGIMTTSNTYGVMLEMTPRTHEAEITNAVERIGTGSSTTYSNAIVRAGNMLSSLTGVARRHIILVSDGAPGAGDEERYLQATRENYRSASGAITLSLIAIGLSSGDKARMETLVNEGHGKLYPVAGNTSSIINDMRDDLNAKEIKEVSDEPFHPQVYDVNSSLMEGVEYSNVTIEDGTVRRALSTTLGGFYGTRVREEADLVLTGDYDVPLYAQWKFGKGSVGSFMSDLNGRWSSDFMADENGVKFLLNAIGGLMPTEDIEPNEIRYELIGENYLNNLSLISNVKDKKLLEEGQTLRVTMTNVETGESIPLIEPTDGTKPIEPVEGEPLPEFYVREYLSEENGFSRCEFVVSKAGVYRIDVERLNADGSIDETLVIYKTFSYSLEYDLSAEENNPAGVLESLAARGGGSLIASEEEILLIFENFLKSLVHTFDPRWLFIILAMVFFLLDLIVRKFKFKWPHELIREARERKEREGKS